MKTATFTIPIYHAKLTAVIADDREDWATLDERYSLGLTMRDYTADGATGRIAPNHHIVILHSKSRPGTVAHELKHAINWLFEDIGVKSLSTTNDEFETYLLEFYFDKAWRWLKQNGYQDE